MPVEAEVRVAENFLLVIAGGTMESMEDLFAYTGLIKEHLLKHDGSVRRVLLDERAMEDRIDALDAYAFSESDDTALAVTSGIRIACLSSPANYEFNRAFETFFQNRSLNFKVFLDMEEAENWLLA